MNLHNIRVQVATYNIWFTVESRRTYRTTGRHCWTVRPDDNFSELREWNTSRPPSALCGYTPRHGTVRLNEYGWSERCNECHAVLRRNGILGVSLDDARYLNREAR